MTLSFARAVFLREYRAFLVRRETRLASAGVAKPAEEVWRKPCLSMPDLSGWQANPAERLTKDTSKLGYNRTASSLPRDCPEPAVWQTGRERAVRGPVYERKTGGYMQYQLTTKSGAKSKALESLEKQEREERLYAHCPGQTTVGQVIKRKKA